MKSVRAYIKKRKLSAVMTELQKIENFKGISITEGYGHGKGRGIETSDHHVVHETIPFLSNIMLEIVCSDELVNSIINAIEKKAHTGLKGDGKIFVFNVEEAVRISKGDRGEMAL